MSINIEEKYIRNIPAISEEMQQTLKSKTVAVIGCGGLGGHIIDALARIGVGGLVLIDCDRFSESNLNRQLLATGVTMGKSKADCARERVRLINEDVRVKAFNEPLTRENAKELLSGCSIAVDALDNIEGRLAAEDACGKLGIYFVHGAVREWSYQASTVAPGSAFLKKLYPADVKAASPSVLSFTIPACAAVQVSETVKVLLGTGETLEGRLLLGDLKTNTVNIIEMK